MISEFRRHKVLWDYLHDDRLLMRLNQIMHRVKLPALPANFTQIFAQTDTLVARRKTELLAGIVTEY